MRTLFKSILCLFAGLVIVSSCKKDESTATGTFTAEEYTFNKANQTFSPQTDLKAEITSPAGIRFIYCYLLRSNKTDSLIAVVTPTESPKEYSLSIAATAFPLNGLSKVSGVKVMVKQVDNSTIEGFIKISYFDPELPQLMDFPVKLAVNLDGEPIKITGNISSIYGLTQVDIYDDYKTENTYELVSSISELNNSKKYALNYAYTYRKAAQHIKVIVKDIYGQSTELIIAMPVDLSLFKPKFIEFPASITPNINGSTSLKGNITTVTGLKRIDIYDDYQGVYVLVSSISDLNSSLNYTLNYEFNYRKRAANIKVIAVDMEDVQSELIIPLSISYNSVLYRDVMMTAQTTGTNTIFFSGTGTTLGNCDLNASEANMAFIFYGTATGPALYSPTNTSSVAANFKCSGISWAIANSASLRATRFRVLVPGTSTGIDNVYAQYKANNIDIIDDSFFLTENGIAAPGSSSAKFDAAATATTGIFNLTNANLIYIRIPDAGGTTYKNALMRVKEAISSAGTSTIKFDIYVQK